MSFFEHVFGRAPESVARAPGRVNLIGEHTDYNGGYVLPTVIPQHTTVEIAAANGSIVRLFTSDARPQRAEYQLGAEAPAHGWIDYIQGVTQVLERDGIALSGFDATIQSTVPVGSGVSSSAALAVALQRALRSRFALPLDDLGLARVAQRAENEFVGARVGIMDPMVSSLGQEGHALFVDTRDLAWRHVPIPDSVELVVIDSGISHRHASGDYNRRREECERAAVQLGVRQLRDLGAEDLPRVALLPEPLNRRARHVITENARVLAAVEALEQDRPERLGELIDESHRSLRDDYQVSIAPIDRLVQMLRAQTAVLGARLTGGGFGGSVMALARRGEAEEASARALDEYRRVTGNEGKRLLPVARAPQPLASA